MPWQVFSIIAIIIHSSLQWPCSGDEAMLAQKPQREWNQRLKRMHTIIRTIFYSVQDIVLRMYLVDVRIDKKRHCICSYARWECQCAIRVFVVLFVWGLSSSWLTPFVCGSCMHKCSKPRSVYVSWENVWIRAPQGYAETVHAPCLLFVCSAMRVETLPEPRFLWSADLASLR